MLPAVLATLFFALSAVLATQTARVLGAIEANFLRLLLGTFLLGLWAHLNGKGVQGAGFPIFFVSGCLGFGLGDLALFQSLIRLGSRLTILLVHCLAVPMAAGVEWVWLGTTLTARQMGAAAIILLGVLVALAPSKPIDWKHEGRGVVLLGICYGVVAAFGQAMGAVLSRKAFAVGHLTGQTVDGITAAYQRILGGLLIVSVAFAFRRRKSPRGSTAAGGEGPIPRRVWGWVVLNALAGPTLGVSCYQWALQLRGTGIVLPIVATTPLAVMPFSRALEGDRPGWISTSGAIIAVIGVILLTWASG